MQGAGHRIGRAAERNHEAVAFALLDRAYAIMRGDRLRHGLIQAGHRRGHLLGLGLP